MTGMATAPNDLPLDRLETWLRGHVEGFRGPIAAERFAGGQSNPSYRLDAASGQYVLRRKPSGPLLPSAHAVDREFRVMRALAGTQVPVPRVHALCEDDAVIGSAFYVMEFLDGRIFWDQRLPEIADPAERGAMFDSMNAVIAALHNVDYGAVGLGDFGRPGNYMGRQIARWSRQYRASETETIAAMDRLIDWLPQHLPPESAPAIVHGDYRMDNLVFHKTEPRVIGVLDWELSTIGDPLADFAYHVMTWRVTPELFRGLAGIDFAASAFRTRPPMSPPIAAAPAATASRPGISTWFTACSASPRSCRGSPSARSTAPPPAPKPPKSAASPAPWPSRPGTLAQSLEIIHLAVPAQPGPSSVTRCGQVDPGLRRGRNGYKLHRASRSAPTTGGRRGPGRLTTGSRCRTPSSRGRPRCRPASGQGRVLRVAGAGERRPGRRDDRGQLARAGRAPGRVRHLGVVEHERQIHRVVRLQSPVAGRRAPVERVHVDRRALFACGPPCARRA